jgi:hypothetical protein
MPLYRAFGLTLASERAVPGLVPHPDPHGVDTQILFDTPPDLATRTLQCADWHVTPDGDESAAPALRAWRLGNGAYYRLRYADGTEFVLDRTGSRVWVSWEPSSTLADTAAYLLGPVLGLVLRLRGVTCLHASAVAVGSGAVAFVGAASAGKSTAAAAFVRMGHRALADDVVALTVCDGIACVVPAYAQLRLWPDSVKLLYGSADALPPLTPTWEKRGLDLSGADAFQDQPLPLKRIYLLQRRSPDSTTRIERAGGRVSLLSLLGHAYVNYLLERGQTRRDFECLSALVTQVPVRRLSMPDAADGGVALRHAIVADCEAP